MAFLMNWGTVHAWAKKVLRFAMPWACAICRAALPGVEDEGFCGLCWLGLPRIQGLVCQRCGAPLAEGGEHCFACRREAPPLLMRSAVAYRGGVRGAVHRFKYAGRPSLAQAFGLLLSGAFERCPELHAAQALVPVPLHSAGERSRGYNQAALLARALSRATRIPVLDGLVLRKRPTRPQVRLKKAERRVNVAGAFGLGIRLEARGLIEGKRFLLIDDVGTTGSTLAACAAPLLAAGAQWVRALTLARDE